MGFEKNFIKPRVSEDIPHHDSSTMSQIGANMVLLDDKSYPSAGIRMTTRQVLNVPKDVPDYVEMHSHDVDQVFVFFGEPDNPESLEVEFIFEGEKFNIKSPMTVFVPKGVAHTQKVIGGSGRYITLLMQGTYE
jgi:hypothetical protein